LEAERERAARAVARALALGADDAEVTCAVVDRFSAEARDAELTKLERSIGRGLTLRVFRDGAKAVGSTSDGSPEGIEATIRAVVDVAAHVAPDPYGGLADATATDASDDRGLGLFAADVAARAPEAKIADALELERAARAFDPRITNSSGAAVADATTTIALANSRGFVGSYRATQASRGVSPIATRGAERRNASYGSAARSYGALETSVSIGATAARRAIGMLGARPPATGRCAIVFERDVAAAVLADLFTAVSASNVAIGNSFFASKIGERVGSPLVTIVDDGRLPGGLGSAPFDDEGTPTRRTVVVEAGVLRTFLYDVRYARRLGARTTGNASGNGVGATNFVLGPGAGTLAELIAATPRGILVTETIGFATESVTGTYSRGASGYAIEGGELAHPIDRFTIAGNLLDMLAAVDRVAGDLVLDQQVASPSFRVAEMTVSGA